MFCGFYSNYPCKIAGSLCRIIKVALKFFLKNFFFQNTPLHYAAKKQFIEIVEILLKKGADMNQRNMNGVIEFCDSFNSLIILRVLVNEAIL